MTAPRPTFNPARVLAVRVLTRVLAGETFAAPALDAALAEARLPARDAGLATHLVYGTLRYAPMLEAALAPLLRGETHPKTRALLLAGAFEKLVLGTPAHAVVSEYVNVARLARLAPPGLVNAVLRRVERPAETDETRYALPEWLIETFRTAYGERADAVLESQLQPQPLWLSLSDAGVRSLEAEGSVVEPGPNDVDRVTLSRPLRDTAAYRQGQAQPINPASLSVVDALGEVEGQRVLDLAGGAGVKAAMLAARGARVTSVDVMARKHGAARANLKRLGLQADFLTHDLTLPLDVPPAPLVLLDAPCTGTGTLRAHPEIKLRLTPGAVGEMATLQARMLPNAAALVEPGGLLVYSVCSVTPQEGQEVVRDFLAAHPEFTPESLPDLGLPVTPAGEGVLTVPEDGVDGFFITRLRKAGGREA
ncbi:tRNA/rRNA cytosine-C5-methylase [Deinococcus metallilatus]|uniref:16S rRNA (Cytosine967-C5)-methyltransferase n=1 Tax=Deinococcus metallilatus TaxID=1211322 RepID=A0AAJ5F2I9_9DEIO|nr:RsmB/NOP family class I SAM-dependent RNA methyltransferase [Deinococcus metallilatus]MBB5296672.1 16S rRNA (cytosine967-C5)-methyltransferase [Deinococcus metallilatus]QBY09242.1 tRNA/rRNA cytosine-C5-methylase [Deinococcus metallilatus]RXJ09763.1 tRNA/rRNA cytosine-C5-methylase [Deinococcus metallilatus]TLK24228.1 RsmB/NOP family class I SAM-dependent RNA methyltransferase [Deinococcus metallilatus]GMA13702.1 16S rRNA m5C967 methyltransferase [Deinococcus metallilatus]